MEVELSQKQIEAIASKLAALLRDKITQPEFVTTKEAAAILCISPSRMRQIADRYPHIKKGNAKQGKLLFYRESLYDK